MGLSDGVCVQDFGEVEHDGVKGAPQQRAQPRALDQDPALGDVLPDPERGSRVQPCAAGPGLLEGQHGCV